MSSDAETPAMATVPQMLLANAVHRGGAEVAMRHKSRGIWQNISWAAQADVVKCFALGLASHGFGRGDRLALVGGNRPRLYQGFLAAQCLGGVPVPLYPDVTTAEICHLIGDSGATVAVVEDQEQVDKLLAALPDTPSVRLIVYDEPKGLRDYDQLMLVGFEEVQELGRAYGLDHPDIFDEAVEAGRSDDVAVLSYTAGTTGTPKGVLLTYRNLLDTGDALVAQDGWRDGEESTFALTPLAWPCEALVSAFTAVRRRMSVNMPESPETLQRDLRELGPTVMIAPPRFWENLLRDVQLRFADTKGLKAWVHRKLWKRSQEADAARRDGGSASPSRRVVGWLAEILLYAPVRDWLGLGRIRHAYVGGAAPGPDTLRAFRGIGVDLRECYGLTECSALAVVQSDGHVGGESVGMPLPDLEVTVAPSGEVLVRGVGVFKGYHDDPGATAAALATGGWLRTGDIGRLEADGQLVIVDRAGDVETLDDGTVVAPASIESRLRFSLYIREAVVVGANRPHLAAMLNIDVASVGQWAGRQDLVHSGYGDLSRHDAVYDLLEEEVRRVNETLPPESAIGAFLLLPKELDPDDGEVTRIRSLRREVIRQRYGPLIDALYEDVDAAHFSTVVTHEDGRSGTIDADVHIRRLQRQPAAEAIALEGTR